LLHNKDLQKLQAMMMIQMKLGKNMSNVQIAKEMGVHYETVASRMKLAEEAGLFLDMKNEMISRILPKAMKAVDTALEDGDSETGLEILRAFGIVRDPRVQKTSQEVQEDTALQEAINEVREQRALDSATIDGAIIGRGGLAGLLTESPEAASTELNSDGNSTLAPVAESPEETSSDDLSPRHEIRPDAESKGQTDSKEAE
jgi:hypothetical protein